MSDKNLSLLTNKSNISSSDKFYSKIQTLFEFTDNEFTKVDICDNIGTKFPQKIQELLFDDFYAITVSKSFPSLPYSPNINQIIDKYLQSKKKICEMIKNIKSGKRWLFNSLPNGCNNVVSYEFGDVDYQYIYINDIFSKVKLYIEKFYIKSVYTEEEKDYLEEKSKDKLALNVLGVTYLIRMITLISQLTPKMNLTNNEKGIFLYNKEFFDIVLLDFVGFIEKLFLRDFKKD